MGRKTPHQRLLDWREGLGFSLTEASAKIGCSRAWLSYIERGERTPGTIDLARRIEKITGISERDWPAKRRKPRARKELAAE